jgi:phosphoenolpyruvate carboxylase
MKIPRTMSTQHPDNVTIPFFSEHPVMSGDDEVQEAYYVYSHLNIDEQLWDVEGKEVDNYVVYKLLSKYSAYFKDAVLGKDKILTIRVPNPDIEKTEAKVVAELLHSIPRNHDLATLFYKEDTAPVFEVVVPMCQSEKPLILIKEYYKEFIHKTQHTQIKGTTVAQWLGEFKPADIIVTPLFETKYEILHAHEILEKYIIEAKVTGYQRVWFARSDPALNYGSVAAILLVKVGLQRVHALEKKHKLDILPIIGMGSSPFRGNFKPSTVEQILGGYPSVQTFTIQSAFKYDHPVREVMQAVDYINKTARSTPFKIDEQLALKYIDIIHHDYESTIKELAPLINQVSKHIPARRKRKLHVGLFGYSRNTSGISLPRAITFCASLYSIGIPPELFGLSTLTKHDIEQIKQCYANFEYDMAEALQYYNEKNLAHLPAPVQEKIAKAAALFTYEVNKEHEELTTKTLHCIQHNEPGAHEHIIKSARIRGYLG